MTAKRPITIGSHSKYDEMPYISYPFPDTHPSHMAAIARIFGLKPPAIETARILEIGCASGGNLTPIAFYYPKAQFVGIDYSKVHIKDGKAIIEKMGLSNIELIHMNAADITPDFGVFDYIICHGVYSWVPQEVQTAILRTCNQNLSKNGVAYISYNTYPGWKTQEIARDAMLFHTRNIDSLQEKVSHGRGMIQYMHEMSNENSIFRQIMNYETELIKNAEPYYIAHEYCETHNAPCYFNEFNRLAESQGLAYLGESAISSMFAENWGIDHRERLINASGGDQVVLEQYLDFLNNRTFRQTLLVKKLTAQAIRRNIKQSPIRALCYQSNITSIDTTDLPEGSKRYTTFNNIQIITDNLIQQAILQILMDHYPNPITFDELKEEIDKTGSPSDDVDLLIWLERLLISGFIQPWSTTFAQKYLTKNSPLPTHPKIDPQTLQHAVLTEHATSHLHQSVRFASILELFVIPLLDGTHTIDQIVNKVIKAVENEQIKFLVTNTEETITDMDKVKEQALLHTQTIINFLKNMGYLLA